MRHLMIEWDLDCDEKKNDITFLLMHLITLFDSFFPFCSAPSRLPYNYLVGGVFAISKDHLIQVNGYSNLYWGWGAEDDDMSHRYV